MAGRCRVCGGAATAFTAPKCSGCGGGRDLTPEDLASMNDTPTFNAAIGGRDAEVVEQELEAEGEPEDPALD